ncbi:MAG: type II secretion system protein [Planctomycetota bacterium]
MTPHRTAPQTRSAPGVGASQRTTGFTLVELLVAISIVSGIVFLFSQVFSTAQDAVARGRVVSQTISQTQSIEEQLFEDAAAMRLFKDDIERSGDTPGFLVIINHRTPDPVELPDDKRAYDFSGAPDPADRAAENLANNIEDWPRRIRSDQLVFFRSASGLEGVTPGASTRLDSAARAGTARIYYGHLSRVNGSGDADPLGTGVNLTTADLLLGRQALLILNPVDATTLPDGGGGGDNVVLPPASWNFNSTIFEFEVDNALGGADELWKGATDAISLLRSGPFPPGGLDFAGLFDSGSVNSLYDDHVNPIETTSTPPSPEVDDGLATDRYHRSALSWAFPVVDRRLLAQTLVEINEYDNNDNPDQRDDIVEQVGRLHAVLSPYVSDFIVEFAADITDDVELDTNGDIVSRRGDAGFQPDGLPDGEPDLVHDRDGHPGGAGRQVRDNNEFAGLIGTVRWYTAGEFAYCPGDFSNATTAPATPFNPATDGIVESIVWPVPGTVNQGTNGATDDLTRFYQGAPIFSGESKVGSGLLATDPPGPQQNRLTASGSALGAEFQKYPPKVDNNVLTSSGFDAADAAFVWGHTGDEPGSDQFIEGDGKYWPYMIRIRYRLHDPDGEFGSIDPASDPDNPVTVNGTWYEIILPVPR